MNYIIVSLLLKKTAEVMLPHILYENTVKHCMQKHSKNLFVTPLLSKLSVTLFHNTIPCI